MIYHLFAVVPPVLLFSTIHEFPSTAPKPCNNSSRLGTITPSIVKGTSVAIPSMVNEHPYRPELARAANEFANREAGQWCSELQTHGQGEDYNWGFRVYRTVYTPESDRVFATGLEILSAHLRRGIFDDVSEEDDLDDFPNQQLWQRMRTEVIEDRDIFNNIPPAAIQKHFQAWIEEQGYHLPNANSPDPSLKRASSLSHRFCIIIDAEALQNLVRCPLLPPSDIDPREHIGVKVLDVECNADSSEYPTPFDEGWIWAAPVELPKIWFECAMLAPDEMRDTNDDGQPVLSEDF